MADFAGSETCRSCRRLCAWCSRRGCSWGSSHLCGWERTSEDNHPRWHAHCGGSPFCVRSIGGGKKSVGNECGKGLIVGGNSFFLHFLIFYGLGGCFWLAP